MDINEEKKSIFESLTKIQTELIFNYDGKITDFIVDNNSNIRNIIILEAAFLSGLLLFSKNISNFNIFALKLFLGVSLVSFLTSILAYSFLLKEIVGTELMKLNGSIFILNKRFNTAKILLNKVIKNVAELEIVKEKINQIISTDTKDEMVVYIKDQYYAKSWSEKKKDFLFKFSSWKNWQKFFAVLGNYSFILGLILTIFLIVGFMILSI